jgi:hypothetical protein
MTDGTDTLPLSEVRIGVTGVYNSVAQGSNTPEASNGAADITANQTGAGGAALVVGFGVPAPLVTNEPRGTTEVDYQYQLNLPADQPEGSYTGGLVTFTATGS